jgi:hypothetical protein
LRFLGASGPFALRLVNIGLIAIFVILAFTHAAFLLADNPVKS